MKWAKENATEWETDFIEYEVDLIEVSETSEGKLFELGLKKGNGYGKYPLTVTGRFKKVTGSS